MSADIVLEYMPYSGPREHHPVQVGDRVMKNALSHDCGRHGTVIAIEEATHYGQNTLWVTVQDDDGSVHHYSPGGMRRWFVIVDL